MKTIIHKKGIHSYRWHLLDYNIAVESGNHVGPLNELKEKLAQKRACYLEQQQKAREEALAHRRSKNPAGRLLRRVFNCHSKQAHDTDSAQL